MELINEDLFEKEFNELPLEKWAEKYGFKLKDTCENGKLTPKQLCEKKNFSIWAINFLTLLLRDAVVKHKLQKENANGRCESL